MDTVLMIATGLSLALAGGMGFLLARARREERLRSDARVALLAELSAEPRARGTEPVFDAPLFEEHVEPSSWPRRLAAAGAAAVVIVAAAAGVSVIGRPGVKSSEAVPIGSQTPLELMSLGHQQVEGSFTITGLVQNPRTAAARSRVQATAVVFGADGAVLASGRAPLDVASLAPGDESPFIIRILVTGAARYRVGFRGANDEPLGHVDRRDPGALARKELR